MNIALLLPGQGTRIPEHLKEIWLQNEHTERLIRSAEKQLQQPISEWFTMDVSNDTWKAQVSTYVGGMCMYHLYKKNIGLYPKFVLGHSLGEITALTIAGAIDFETGLKLVDIRGKAMKKVIEEKEDMGMMAVFTSPEKIKDLLKGWDHVHVANYNSQKQTVISGLKQAIQEFVKQFDLEGIMLGVSGAFHTNYMQKAADYVYEQLEDFSFHAELQTQVISNKSAEVYNIENIKQEITSQIVSPVKWSQSVEYALRKGVQLFVDLSPNGMFTKMFNDLDNVFAFNNEETMNLLYTELKDEIEVSKKYDLFSRALGIIVSTKNNNTDVEAYENIVISGYNQIKSQIGKAATLEEIDNMLSLLEIILRTKKVSEQEIKDYKNKLVWEVAELRNLYPVS